MKTPKTPPLPQLLTLAEVAALTSVSLEGVRHAVKRGQLRALRIGSRRVRVSLEALQEWVGEEK